MFVLKGAKSLSLIPSTARRFASDSKPPKLTSPIYREEGAPVVFELEKKSYIPSQELNPREDPSTLPSKRGMNMHNSIT